MKLQVGDRVVVSNRSRLFEFHGRTGIIVSVGKCGNAARVLLDDSGIVIYPLLRNLDTWTDGRHEAAGGSDQQSVSPSEIRE